MRDRDYIVNFFRLGAKESYNEDGKKLSRLNHVDKNLLKQIKVSDLYEIEMFEMDSIYERFYFEATYDISQDKLVVNWYAPRKEQLSLLSKSGGQIQLESLKNLIKEGSEIVELSEMAIYFNDNIVLVRHNQSAGGSKKPLEYFLKAIKEKYSVLKNIDAAAITTTNDTYELLKTLGESKVEMNFQITNGKSLDFFDAREGSDNYTLEDVSNKKLNNYLLSGKVEFIAKDKAYNIANAFFSEDTGKIHEGIWPKMFKKIGSSFVKSKNDPLQQAILYKPRFKCVEHASSDIIHKRLDELYLEWSTTPQKYALFYGSHFIMDLLNVLDGERELT